MMEWIVEVSGRQENERARRKPTGRTDEIKEDIESIDIFPLNEGKPGVPLFMLKETKPMIKRVFE